MANEEDNVLAAEATMVYGAGTRTASEGDKMLAAARIVAEAVQVAVDAVGMTAQNAARARQDLAQEYGDEAFFNLAGRLEKRVAEIFRELLTMASEGDKMQTFSVDEVNQLKTVFAKLRRELQATRWAMWWAIDAWREKRRWGDGHGGRETTPTDLGRSLVGEGRKMEDIRESKNVNELTKAEEDLLSRL